MHAFLKPAKGAQRSWGRGKKNKKKMMHNSAQDQAHEDSHVNLQPKAFSKERKMRKNYPQAH